jgi:hypothetical protein
MRLADLYRKEPAVTKVEIREGTSCLGCLGIVVILIALWAVVFGVTVDGKHYGLTSCKTDGGVHIDTGDKK